MQDDDFSAAFMARRGSDPEAIQAQQAQDEAVLTDIRQKWREDNRIEQQSLPQFEPDAVDAANKIQSGAAELVTDVAAAGIENLGQAGVNLLRTTDETLSSPDNIVGAITHIPYNLYKGGISALVNAGMPETVAHIDQLYAQIEADDTEGDKAVQEMAQYMIPFLTWFKGFNLAAGGYHAMTKGQVVTSGAAADAVTAYAHIPPDFPRISDFLTEFENVTNKPIIGPFIEYLAADDGSEAENRLRNVLDNAGIPLAVVQAFRGAFRLSKNAWQMGKAGGLGMRVSGSPQSQIGAINPNARTGPNVGQATATATQAGKGDISGIVDPDGKPLKGATAHPPSETFKDIEGLTHSQRINMGSAVGFMSDGSTAGKPYATFDEVREAADRINSPSLREGVDLLESNGYTVQGGAINPNAGKAAGEAVDLKQGLPELSSPNAARELWGKLEEGAVKVDDYWGSPPATEIEKAIHNVMKQAIASGDAPMSKTRLGKLAQALTGTPKGGGKKWTKTGLAKEAERLVNEGKIMMPEEPRQLEVLHRIFDNAAKTEPQRQSVQSRIYKGENPGMRPYGKTGGFGGQTKAAKATVTALRGMDDSARASTVDEAWEVLEGTHELTRPKGATETGLLQTNAKMLKSAEGYKGSGVNPPREPLKTPDGQGVQTTGVSLYHAYREPQVEICAKHAICKDACLGSTSGFNFVGGGGADRDALKGSRLYHYRTNQAFLRDPEAFITVLDDEIGKAYANAQKKGDILGIRLNVLSDVPPKVYKSLMDKYPDVTFYDYTKLHSNKPIAPNHHLTYSSTGVSNPELGVVNPHQNWKHMVKRMDEGYNVAMPFSVHRTEPLPKFVKDMESGKIYKVIDGDVHDFRPADDWDKAEGVDGVIVGLRNKDMTKQGDRVAAVKDKQSPGFFTYYDPAKGDTVEIAKQGKATSGNMSAVALTSGVFLAQFPHWGDYNPDLADEILGEAK